MTTRITSGRTDQDFFKHMGNASLHLMNAANDCPTKQDANVKRAMKSVEIAKRHRHTPRQRKFVAALEDRMVGFTIGKCELPQF